MSGAVDIGVGIIGASPDAVGPPCHHPCTTGVVGFRMRAVATGGRLAERAE